MTSDGETDRLARVPGLGGVAVRACGARSGRGSSNNGNGSIHRAFSQNS